MFDSAVDKADKLTSEQDTMILVTADHSHLFFWWLCASRELYLWTGGPFNALDGRSFTSILYGNGPGYKLQKGDPKYRQQTAVPLSSVTHSGEDVAIFARGPQAHLVHGVQE